MRNISFMLTVAQVRNRTKTVTRRLGWRDLKVGDRLQGCEKCQGRKKGEPLVALAVIKVVSVRREKLRRLTDDLDYGFRETCLEGFEGTPREFPSEFVGFFCATHKRCTPETEVARIAFKYVDA